jgi:hypothetical protein
VFLAFPLARRLPIVGTPLHPRLSVLQPALDAVTAHLDAADVPFILNPPYLLPSARYTAAKLPAALSRHLLSLLPSAPRLPSPRRMSSRSGSTLRPNIARTWTGVTAESSPGTPAVEHSEASPPTQSRFLAMPSMNMGLNMDAMDVRKWNWGALTFGKGGSKKPRLPEQAKDESPDKAASSEQADPPSDAEEAEADGSASEPVSTSASGGEPPETADDDDPTTPGQRMVGTTVESNSATPMQGHPAAESDLAEAIGSDLEFDADALASLSFAEQVDQRLPPTILEPPLEPEPDTVHEPLPPVLMTSVWLDEPGDEPMKRRRVLYLTVRFLVTYTP